MSFSEWNDSLLRYFFGEFASDEQVRLTVTCELIESEFYNLGGLESFKAALRNGPEWPAKMQHGWPSNPRTFFGICDGLYRQWRKRDPRHSGYKQPYDDYDGPPYFIFLCSLCLAWTLDIEGVRDSNFYGRLERLYPDHSLNQNLGGLSHLWKGLEWWSKNQKGRLGHFRMEQLGNHAHVGLPKSQVILTPGKIERTPALFYELALSPDENLSKEKLRNKLLDAFDRNHFLLGKGIYDNIEQNSDLGKSALQQLVEHFEEWDGKPPVRLQSSKGSTISDSEIATEESLALVVSGLEFIVDLNSWITALVPVMDDVPDGQLYLNQNGKTYRSRFRAGLGTAFTCETDKTNVLHYSDIENDNSLQITWRNEYEGEREFVVSILASRKIECFAWTPDFRILVQLESLPSEGSCYCLVHEEMQEHFRRWCEDAGVSINTSIPQGGLSSTSRLLLIDGIGNATSEQWAMFPDGGDSRRRRPRKMTLIGGSRQRRERATRTYLPFDPPILKVEAVGVSLDNFECEHCSLKEITPESTQSLDWISSTETSRLFEISPNPGATRVAISLTRDGEILGRPIAFRLLNRSEFDSVSIAEFKTDQLGRATINEFDSGVCGAIAPFDSDYQFEEWHFDTWPQHETSDDQAPQILMDWISANGSVRYTSLRNFVSQRLASELRTIDLSNELKALFNLGHVEIQMDHRGRWSHIHGAQVVLYPIPFLEDGKALFVLSGAYSTALVHQIEAACHQHSLDFDRHPQLGGKARGHWLVPSRISVIANDPNDVVNLGRQLNIHVLDCPPAWSISKWCGGVDDWYSQLAWHVGTVTMAEASYRPLQYRTMVPKIWPDDIPTEFNLVRSLDLQTKKHFNYALVKKVGNEFYHAICGHKTWGTWFTHRHMILSQFSFLEETGIPMPYDPVDKTLLFPLELDPPPLMSKALTLCSGLASLRVGPEDNNRHLTSEYGLSSYKGNCVAYRSIPKSIADTLLMKLGAKSKEYCSNDY